MKIGIFTDSYFPQINGVTFTLVHWKKELEKLGHEVFIYYPDSDEYEPKKGEMPLPSIPFPFYKGYEIGFPSFGKVEKDLDIVHIQTPAIVGLFGLAVAKKQKIPCIMTYHTPPDRYLQEMLPIGNKLLQEALKVMYYKYEKELLINCQLITSPSAQMIDMLKERWGKILPKTMHFSNGIDTAYFKKGNAEAYRKRYKIPKGKIIGYTGRHTREKHLEDIVAYADKFDGTVLVGGDGPMRAHYEELAKGKNNIMFLGFFPREDLIGFYSLVDVFIMPSTVETEGLVVLEANACETPAVGAYAMALKSTIKEGVNGYHYKPGDIEGLDRAVKKAFKNLKPLEKSSKKWVAERSVAKTAKKLESIYSELIK